VSSLLGTIRRFEWKRRIFGDVLVGSENKVAPSGFVFRIELGVSLPKLRSSVSWPTASGDDEHYVCAIPLNDAK
jgi:hypothetical protein